MKINSFYSILIIALTAFPFLKGMENPIQKKTNKTPQLNPSHIVKLISEHDISLGLLKNLVFECDPFTILRTAIEEKKTKAVETLLDNNLVNPNQKLEDGKTVLHIATKIPDLPVELLKILLKHTQEGISILDGNNTFPIDYAIENMNLALIKTLIEHNSPIGQHSISDAVSNAYESNKDHLEIITLLCDHYPLFIDLRIEDQDIQKPLDFALFNNKITIVRLLLEKGANPNFSDTCLVTPLFYAIQDSIKSIPLLKKYGAHMFAETESDDELDFLKKGMTPSEYAHELFKQGQKDIHWLEEALTYLLYI